MKRTVSRLVAILCVVILIVCNFFTGGKNTEEPAVNDETKVPVQNVVEEKPDNSWLDKLSTKSKNPEAEIKTDYVGSDTITVGTSSVTLQNPFFISGSADTTVTDLIMVPLLETERGGYVIQSGIKGETVSYNNVEYTYNGIADVKIDGNTLHFTLDENIYFSDGVNLTADDVIFTMYVLADPIYDGFNQFASLPIEGIDEYHGTVQQKWKLILHDLDAGEKTDGYTEEEYNAFAAAFKEAGLIFTREIVDGCVENFADDYVYEVMGVDIDELMEDEGLQIAFSQYFWDYATGYGEDGLWYDISGKAYDLENTFPTIEEYWDLICLNHGYDISDSGINYERIGNRNFNEILISVIKEKYPSLTEASENTISADNISGIKKTGMYSFSVTMTELSPEHLNGFCFYIAPLHHYGSRDAYKYSENKFGFTKSDLSGILAKTDAPLGAGAYKYDGKDENGNILLKRNSIFYKGCPKITNLVVTTDTENADLYCKVHENENLYTGNYIEVKTSSYVVIGMSAEQVSVSGDPLSNASVKLRNAFATAFKAFREIAVSEWGNTDVRCVAGETEWPDEIEALTRSVRLKIIRLLKAAGYVWDSDNEVFIKAPLGASMSYEVKVFDSDAAFIVLEYAKELFADLGIELKITVQSTKMSLKNIVLAGEAQMWVMQLNEFSEKHLYEFFHSEGKNAVFVISSDKLDRLIEKADSEFSNSISAACYKDILEDVLAMGVIVPIYNHIDAVFYSEKMVSESIAADMTDNWTWVREAHLLEAK